MLRLLYRCAVRLHPPAFRKRFGDEMLAIFDQAAGRLAAIRLLADGFISLTRQWLLRPEFWSEIPAPAQQPALDGIPSFCSLDPFRPSASAIVPGLVLSIAVFSLTCVAIKYSWIHVLHVHIPAVQFEAPQWIPQNTSHSEARESSPDTIPQTQTQTQPRSTAPSLPPNQQSLAETASTSNPHQAAAVVASKHHEIAHKSSLKNAKEVAAQPLAAGPASGASQAVSSITDEDAPLDATARHAVIEGAVANLNQYYVDADTARKMSDAMRAHEANGDDNAATDGEVFADLLTRQMRDASHDPYVVMLYDAADTAEIPHAPTAEDIARYKKDMAQRNCTFEKVEMLPRNIGYVKVNSFPDASICGPAARAAMRKLNHADAIIFDLRDNPGGYANMVALLASYLFDRPTHLNDFYDRGANSTEESWSLPPIPGNKLADKPAFVLTSRTTFSAAEAFAYDLKILKRATIVGETTSGRGHMGAPHPIDDHFTIRILGIRVTNPVSKTNWEGTGVEPDVKARSADALATARTLAETRLQNK